MGRAPQSGLLGGDQLLVDGAGLRVTVTPQRSPMARIRSGLPLATRIEVPAWNYSRKLISRPAGGRSWRR